MPTLLQTFPTPKDFLALAPEDLAGVLVARLREQRMGDGGGFLIEDFLGELFLYDRNGYPQAQQQIVMVAIAEALSWLVTQGIIVRNPSQPAHRYVFTRRGAELRSPTDVEVYRKGRALPVELLQPSLASKVHPMFLRGDYDVAVFQAFKEVEVAVRNAAQYPDEVVGRDLMARAFNPDSGPLRDTSVVPAERQAEQALFMGAIGHAKNPTSHRDVKHPLEAAAKLIIFASYLLDIVEIRALVA